jgi:hypothetical protein
MLGPGASSGTTGAAACPMSCSAGETSSATLVDEFVMLWITGPSSPGLSTRTEIVVLHPEQAPGSSAAARAGPQFQSQFHVHCEDDDDDGVIVLVPVDPSEQFHVQFHTQSVGTPGSGSVA